MIDVNIIVGDLIKVVDGSVIFIVLKVSFGFVVGGSEFGKVEYLGCYLFGGGSGGGVFINFVVFFVINGDGVKVLYLDK